MKVSIVTPSFNQGKFIEKCLASVRNQQGDFEVEHIILDNCSTDATSDALARYQDSPGDVQLRVVVKADEGQTAAINGGFSLASGDIVCWLNTDEWYEDGSLTKVTEYFARHPDVDVVFGDCNFVDLSGNLLKRKREHFFSKAMLVYYGCFIPSCATFVRRKVIDAGVLLNPEFKVTMDFDWYVRLADAGYRFAHIPLTVASFTWHEMNISSIFVERRKIERRLVQDRHNGIAGPYWFRSVIYWIILQFWLAVRVTRQLIG